MEKSCENIRQRIPALVTGTLSAEKAADLQHHISQCPNCSEYLKALQADDRLFEDFAKTMQPTIARLENEVIDGLNRATSKRAVEPISIRRTVMKSRIVKVAAAALIIIAILVGASILTGPGEETVEIVKQEGESDRGTSELPKQDKADLEAVVEAELDEIRHMVAASDIDGLVAMLKDGQWDSKLAAANYLGRIGDLRALGALEQLSAEWQGDAADNPFADAISKIKGRFEPEEQQSQAGSAGQSKWATEEIAGEGQKAMSAGGVVVAGLSQMPESSYTTIAAGGAWAIVWWKRLSRPLMVRLFAASCLSSAPCKSTRTPRIHTSCWRRIRTMRLAGKISRKGISRLAVNWS